MRKIRLFKNVLLSIRISKSVTFKVLIAVESSNYVYLNNFLSKLFILTYYCMTLVVMMGVLTRVKKTIKNVMKTNYDIL